MVGVFYIIGTVAGILSVGVAGTMFDKSDYLIQLAENDNQIILGALFVLTMGLALVMVPVLLFPILRKHNETLAMGYVVFRGALEGFIYIALVIVWLLLLALSQQYVKAGAPDDSFFQSLGAALKQANDWIGSILTIVFILGGVMFYSLLYQSQLVPRWLSGWGLIAAVPYIAAAFLTMFDVIDVDSTPETLLYMPLAIQEMVLALWLIVKGFNPSALGLKVSEGVRP